MTKPQNAGSDDTWGQKLNADLDTIDAELFRIAELSGAAAAPAGQVAAGRYHAIGLAEFGAATMTPAGSTMYCVPITQLVRASGIAVEITTVAGFAGTMVIGLYDSDTNGRPGALVEQCAGTIDCNSSTGIKTLSFAATRLVRPDQWIVMVSPATVGSLAFRKGVLSTVGSSRRLGMTDHDDDRHRIRPQQGRHAGRDPGGLRHQRPCRRHHGPPRRGSRGLMFERSDLAFEAGVFANRSKKASINRYIDADFVRFPDGPPQQVGGWLAKTTTGAALSGKARAMRAWKPLSLGASYAAIGTHTKLFLLANSTPRRHHARRPHRRHGRYRARQGLRHGDLWQRLLRQRRQGERGGLCRRGHLVLRPVRADPDRLLPAQPDDLRL
jgi:hypothetical protein